MRFFAIKRVAATPPRPLSSEQMGLVRLLRRMYRLYIAKRCEVSGTVVDSRGNAARNAHVWLVSNDASVSRRTKCDPSGQFSFIGIEPGIYRWHAGWVDPSLSISAPVAEALLASGQKQTFRFVVQEQCCLIGCVASEEGAIREFGVQLEHNDGVVFIDPMEFESLNGSFRIEALPAGEYKITVLSNGYRRSTHSVRVMPGQEVDIGLIFLQRGVRVRGTVSTANGALVRDAVIRIGRSQDVLPNKSVIQQMFLWRYSSTSDSFGVFTFDGIDYEENAPATFIWAELDDMISMLYVLTKQSPHLALHKKATLICELVGGGGGGMLWLSILNCRRHRMSVDVSLIISSDSCCRKECIR